MQRAGSRANLLDAFGREARISVEVAVTTPSELPLATARP